MEELDRFLKNKYSDDELTTLATKLNKQFRVNYFWNGWSLLEKQVFSYDEIEFLKKHYEYNQIYNYIIMKYGKNETIIKYKLIEEFMDDAENIGLLEFNVGNSRLDIGKINENSYAYEIKTELDNTLRLEKQIKDYEKIFEFIYVVCHSKHLAEVKKIVPSKVGIRTFEFKDEKVNFKDIRMARKNKSIRKNTLLESLNSKEYAYILKEYLKIDDIPLYKEDRAKLVNKLIKKNELLEIYKDVIRLRNLRRWNYIKQKFDVILPIEIQDIYSKEYF